MSTIDRIGEKKTHRVLIRHAGVGQEEIQGRPVWVIRGQLAPEYFGVISVPGYQRMAMTSGEKHEQLMDALKPGGIGVPDDLLLATHGTHRNQSNGVVSLEVSELIVLDGHQRYAAAKERLERGQQSQSFGVKIIIDLTLAEQMNIFYQINRLQTPVATHLHLRNSSETTTIKALLDMAAETSWFPNVQTDQQRQSGEQITLHMLLEVAVLLHGYNTNMTIEQIQDALKELTDTIGAKRITANVKKFFETVHRCYGTKVGEGADAYYVYEGDYVKIIYRIDFLRGLALLFARWSNFWDKRVPEQLLVPANWITKLRKIRKDTVDDALARSSATKASYRNFMHRIESGYDESPLNRRIAPWFRTMEDAFEEGDE
jgi:hypothetical protein